MALDLADLQNLVILVTSPNLTIKASEARTLVELQSKLENEIKEINEKVTSSGPFDLPGSV